jgi:hypothetical protein
LAQCDTPHQPIPWHAQVANWCWSGAVAGFSGVCDTPHARRLRIAPPGFAKAAATWCAAAPLSETLSEAACVRVVHRAAPAATVRSAEHAGTRCASAAVRIGAASRWHLPGWLTFPTLATSSSDASRIQMTPPDSFFAGARLSGSSKGNSILSESFASPPRVVLSCACSAQDSAQLPCASVRTCAPAVVNHRASWPPAPCRGWFSTATGVFVSVLPTHSPHPADSPRSNLAAALGLLSSGGFSNPKPGWRAAERRHPTGRERMGSPTLQTLQEPILPTPWVCFRGGGQTLTFPWSMRASSPAAGSPLNHVPVTQ